MAHRGPNLKQYFKTRRPLVIGVAGGSCSGKTMVSQLIYNSLQDKSIMILHQDSYYKENSSMSMATSLVYSGFSFISIYRLKNGDCPLLLVILFSW